VVGGQHAFDRPGPQKVGHVCRFRGVAAPELVGVGKWHQQNVAGTDVAALSGRSLECAAAVRHQMEDADVMQVRQRRAFFEALRTLDPKRRGERAVEEGRPCQANGAQHFRQHVVCRGPVRRSGKRNRRFDH